MSDTCPHLETLAVSGGRPQHIPGPPLNEPVTFASSFVAGGTVEYACYGNPSWTALQDAIGALERSPTSSDSPRAPGQREC